MWEWGLESNSVGWVLGRGLREVEKARERAIREERQTQAGVLKERGWNVHRCAVCGHLPHIVVTAKVCVYVNVWKRNCIVLGVLCNCIPREFLAIASPCPK